jgi:spermidine/putrescine transport system substrate-binding protein
VLVAAGLAVAGCSSAQSAPTEPVIAEVDGDITWFTWGEYVAPGLVEAFEEEYGVTVTIETADSSENMVQKLASGQPYDVVTGNSAYMQRMIEGGLLRSFDIDGLENADDIPEFLLNPSYDNGEQRYSVPYSGGATGIIYRTDKIKSIEKWSDLWELPADLNGHVFLLDQVEETMGMSLLAAGENLNESDPAKVEAAVDRLLEIKPTLGGLSTDTRTNVSNGDAWVHHAWSSDAFMLLSDSPFMDDLAFVTPAEGGPFGMNVLNIGAKAKSPGTALLFIDYMLRPDVKVTNAQYIGDLSGSIKGDAAYNDLVKDFRGLQVSDDVYEAAAWKESLTGERGNLWSQQWNRFKAS